MAHGTEEPRGTGEREGSGAAGVPGYGALAFAWGALLLLTALTVGLSRLDLGVWRVWAALAVASAKASLVAAVFMHVRHEGRLLKAFLLVALVTLAVFIGITFLDVLYR